MQGGEGKSSDLLMERKNSLLQLWTKLKNSIFDVLFVVLDKTTNEGEDISLVGLIYESGIDYFQMMQFPFNFTIIMVWNGGETLNNIFNFLTQILQINNLMPSLNYGAFLACLYLLIFLIILVIVDIIYVSYSFTKKKFKFTLPLVLLAQIVPLFVTFLFIPIMEFLLNILNCNPSNEDPNKQVLQYFPTVVCFEGTHIVHVSITLFFTSIFVFISTIVAMTLFEPRMTANTITARRSSNGEVIFIINKVICQFVFSFTPFSDTWIYIVLMFFPALWLFYFYHFQQPYYSKKVGKLFRIFSAYYFWTVLMLSISQVLLILNFQFQGAMVIWFCGLPFIGLNIAYENKSNIDNLFSSNLKFKTGEQLQVHLQYVLLLIHDRHNDQNSNMLLVGYIQKHIETCVEDDCPIKIKKPKKEELLSEMDENCKLLIIQLERMYKQGIKKFPSCTRLHISFAFFYMERLKMNAKAYEEFMLAERASPSFIEEFIIYRFKKIIKQKLEQNKEEESDLIEIIRFDNHVSLCEEAMVQSAKLHKQFWSQLMQETPNLQKLNDTGSKIISIVNSVRSNYTEVNKINSHSPEIIHNYGVYAMFISQNIPEGKKCLSQAKRAYYQKRSSGDLLPVDHLDSDGSCSCLVVSAAHSSMGKILTVNDNFIEMSGYLKEQITQKSIDKILPQVMLFYHEYAMLEWLGDSSRMYMKGQGNTYLREVHKGFLKQKNGFIVPVHYKINYDIFQEKFHVYYKNDKEFNENFDFKIYIITDPKGIIREISSLGFAYFNLTKDNLSSMERYVDQFGLTFKQEIYAEDGLVVALSKKPGFKQQLSLRPEKDREQEKSMDLKPQDGDDFYVKAERIWMPNQQEQQEGEYSGPGHYKNGRKDIGTILYLERIPKEKHQSKEIKLQSLNEFGGDIMSFYEIGQGEDEYFDESSPMMSRLAKKSQLKEAICQLIESQREDRKEKTFVKYGERIKTYRLVNHELKRVVEEFGDEKSEYDEVDEENIGLSLFQIQKLKNPLFVEKIQAAINTNIDHAEVTTLKAAFSVFLVCLTALCILNFIQIEFEFDKLQIYSDLGKQWIDDQFYLNNLIHLAFNSSNLNGTVNEANLNYTQEYSISFNPDLQVAFKNANNEINQIKLSQAMIWLQGDIYNYFSSSSLNQSLSLMFQNYYSGVYPALQSYSLPFEITYVPTIICLVCVLVLGLAMVGLWIYNVMCIDKKCFDIILWFLDIPITYVTYLQVNCSTFIKSYVQVKELIEKGINFHDKNLYLDDYKPPDSAAEDDQFNEQNKSRKIMIARYKKKTLLSRCNFVYVQMFWLLFYSSIVSVVFLSVLKSEVSFYQFINREWEITARQFIWSATIPNNLRLIMEQNITTAGSVDLILFQNRLQNKFLNPVSNMNLAGPYSELINYGGTMSIEYHTAFQGDVCEFERYSEQQATVCKSYLSAKLQGGISSVFTYYATLQRERYHQIEHVQYDYINVLLLQIFSLWKTTLDDSLSSTRNSLTLTIVLFLICSGLGFIVLWAMYLSKLNVRLNQTIQMLNMIPIRMLPKSRKDIRDFFSWIIKEANRNKTQD